MFPDTFGTAHLSFVFQVNLSDLAVCLKSAQSAFFPADILTHRCRKTADVNKALNFRALGSNFIFIFIIVYITPLFQSIQYHSVLPWLMLLVTPVTGQKLAYCVSELTVTLIITEPQ